MNDEATPKPTEEQIQKTDVEMSIEAIELCYSLIANTPIPFAKHLEVVRALKFLEALHKTMKPDPVVMPADPSHPVISEVPPVAPLDIEPATEPKPAEESKVLDV